MKRIFAAVQCVIILAVIAFSTYQLFKGNFQLSLSFMPLLLAYYFLLLSIRKRSRQSTEEDETDG